MVKLLDKIKKYRGVSLRDYAREKRKDIYVSFPPELTLLSKGEGVHKRIPQLDIYKCTGWALGRGIDTTYYALRIFDLLGNSLELDKEGCTIDFIKSMYNKEVKGYVQTRYHERRSVYASHSAIGCIVMLSQNNKKTDWGKPVGKKTLQEYLGKDEVDSILDLITNECERYSGYSDNKDELTTVNATASALWCLWHLEAIEENVNFDKLIEFVDVHAVTIEGKTGFKNEQKDLNPWVCSTYYAFRIFRILEKYGYDIKNKYKGEEVISFLLSCKKKNGGFKDTSIADYHPTIIHTKDALSLIADNRYGLSYDKFTIDDCLEKHVLIEDINSFLKNECVTEKGVYGFAEKEHYFPNIYATLMAIEIVFLLNKLNNDKDKIVFNEKQKNDIFSFLGTCINKGQKAGYRGYSLDSTYIPEEWWIRVKSQR